MAAALGSDANFSVTITNMVGTANSFANGAFVRANASYDAQNTTASFANGAFTKANNALPLTGGTITGDLTINANTSVNGTLIIIGSGSAANAITFADGTLQYTANTDPLARAQANSAYGAANSGSSFANGAFDRANSAASFANGAFVTANSGAVFANAAFVTANASYSSQNTTASFANLAYAHANAAYAQANTGGGGGGGITYTASNTTPASANVGDQWYLTVNDVLYEYINDGTSSYWVDTTSPTMSNNSTSSGGASSAVIVGYNLVFGG